MFVFVLASLKDANDSKLCNGENQYEPMVSGESSPDDKSSDSTSIYGEERTNELLINYSDTNEVLSSSDCPNDSQDPETGSLNHCTNEKMDCSSKDDVIYDTTVNENDEMNDKNMGVDTVSVADPFDSLVSLAKADLLKEPSSHRDTYVKSNAPNSNGKLMDTPKVSLRVKRRHET